MGSRSITEIRFTDGTVGRFYLHWGSPEYQIPNLAEYVHSSWAEGKSITPDNYSAYLSTIDGGMLPAEQIEFEDPGDLEHKYVLDVSTPGELRYSYTRKDLYALKKREQWVPEVEAASRLELYEAAVLWLARIRKQVESLRRRHDQEPDSEVMGLPKVSDLEHMITIAEGWVAAERRLRDEGHG